MCKCTPEIRTPWCGKPGCEMPPQPPCQHGTRTPLAQFRQEKTEVNDGIKAFVTHLVVVDVLQAHRCCSCGDIEWRSLEVAG